MTIKQHVCFTADCDACKKPFEQDGITLHWDSEAEARSYVRDYDWFTLPDGSLLCEYCVEAMLKSGEIKESLLSEYAYEAADSRAAAVPPEGGQHA